MLELVIIGLCAVGFGSAAGGLWLINHKLNTLIMKSEELAQALADAKNQLQANTLQITETKEAAVKVLAETKTLKEMIDRLQEALNNQDNVAPVVQQAFEAVQAQLAVQTTAVGELKTAVKAVDDEVPDA